MSVLVGIFVLASDPVNRYTVVPGTALLLLAFSCTTDHAAPRKARICQTLLCVSLIAGVGTFWRDIPKNHSPLGRAPGRPSWSMEVENWDNDPEYQLRIWPYTGPFSYRMPLLPESGPIPPAKFIKVEPFDLIAKGQEVHRFVAVSGLPSEFRLIVKMRSTQPSDQTDLRIVFEDDEGVQLNVQTISGFKWHEDFWIDLWSFLIPLRGGAHFSDVSRLRVVFQSSADMPHRVSFEVFAVEQANIGSLEPFLPSVREATQILSFEGSTNETAVVTKGQGRT